MTIEFKNGCTLYTCFNRYFINDMINNKEICIGGTATMTTAEARREFDSYVNNL